MRERRGFPRLYKRYKVAVTAGTGKGSNTGEGAVVCRSVELSAGGLRVESKQSLPMGVPVAVRVFCSRPAETYDLEGRVVWEKEDSPGTFRAGIHIGGTRRDLLLFWERRLASDGLGAC